MGPRSRTVRISQDVLDSLRLRAENENRSLSNLIVTYIELVLSFSTSAVREMLSNNGRRRSKTKR